MLGSRTYWWGFFCGVIFLGGALVTARIARPEVISMDSLAPALAGAMAGPVARMLQAHPHVLYVRAEGMERTVISTLILQFPDVQFRPWMDRPPDSGCEPNLPGQRRAVACGSDDFVEASVISMPLRSTIEVAVSTSNSVGDAVLLDAFGRWVVVSSRGVVL